MRCWKAIAAIGVATRYWALSLLLAPVMLKEIETSSAKNIHSILEEKLLSEYGSTTARPVMDAETPTYVGIDLVILRVIELNERYQTLQLSAWFFALWHDEYLMWNTTEYPGVSFLVLPVEKIWRPDIYLIDNVYSKFKIPKDVSATVYPDGYVWWSMPVILYTACRINARFFPFDKQLCRLRFESWHYEMNQLDLNPLYRNQDEASVYFIENGVWRLQHNHVHRFINEYPNNTNFTQVVFTIHLHRRPVFYVFSYILPCGLLSLLSLLTFLHPTQSGEKVSLGMTNLLALVLYQQLVSDSLPPSAIDIPILRYYFTPIIIIGCLSLVDGVVVAVLYHHDITKPVPKWLRFLTKVGPPKNVTTLQPAQNVIEQEALLPDSTLRQTTRKETNHEISSTLDHRGLEEQRDTIPTSRRCNPNYTSDWRQAAAVVDRYFSVLGLVMTITSFTITLVLFLTLDEGNQTEI